MAETDDQAAEFVAEGRQAVVRLKMPREGVCAFVDLVRGRMAFEWALEQDHVVQRADGSCLYHLASTVDDHDFRITHVIRAVEHLSNTPRQMFIAQALGYSLPHYAHLPFVAAPGSAQKLSKRKLDTYLKHPDFKKVYDHGASITAALGEVASGETFSPIVVDFYRKIGYRAEALLNYLLLLGWSLDDRTETFEREEMIEHFTLERVNKSAASFDPQKLMAFQERYMQKVPTPDKVAATAPFLQRAGIVPDPLRPADLDRLTHVVEAAGDRIKVAGDILNYTELFQEDEVFSYDDKAFDKRIRAAAAAALLGRFRIQLEAVDPFDAATLDSMMHRFIESEAITVGQIIHAGPGGRDREGDWVRAVRRPGDPWAGGVSGAHRPSAGATGAGTSMTDSDTSEVGLDFIRQAVADDTRVGKPRRSSAHAVSPRAERLPAHRSRQSDLSQLRGRPGTRWVV